MDARQKVNQAVFVCCLFMATWLGLVFQSWWVFGGVFAVGLALAALNRDLRLTPVARSGRHHGRR